MEQVRWGILGVGDVCEVKAGPGFYKSDHSRLVAVMRRSGDKAADFARRHNVPRWYDDAEELLADPEVDAVYVASPPATHRELVIKAAVARKPVLCEKPMARNAGECREMIAACEDAGVPLWVAYYRRYLPRFRRILQLLSEGEIGVPRSVIVRRSHSTASFGAAAHGGEKGKAAEWRVDPKISGGGLFVDVGSHMIDFLNYAFGPVEFLGGDAINQEGHYPAEDCVAAAFTFPHRGRADAEGADGSSSQRPPVLGSGLWCFSTDEDVDEIAIYGTAGSLRFSCFDESPVLLRKSTVSKSLELGYPPHVHQPLIEAAIAELRGGPPCESTGKTALGATKFMDAVLAGFRGDG